ncbi:MAG: hypothetical protein J6Y19_08120 [Kiritimatiellae bacterium]|nr:hypothetical protein [Kiritimatiellia bacterium]
MSGGGGDADGVVIGKPPAEGDVLLRFGEPSRDVLAALKRLLAKMPVSGEAPDDGERVFCGAETLTLEGGLDEVAETLVHDLADDWADNERQFGRDGDVRWENLAARVPGAPGMLVVYTRLHPRPGIERGDVMYGRGVERVSAETWRYWREFAVTDRAERLLRTMARAKVVLAWLAGAAVAAALLWAVWRVLVRQ